MGLPVRGKAPQGGKSLAFGSSLKSEFPTDPEWMNLNHGSFGTIPKAMVTKLREYQDQAEARPDPFIRYDRPRLLNESREAVAALVNAPLETMVIVGNATEGVNTVLKNIEWSKDGKDVFIFFSTAYEACAKAVDFIIDYTHGGIAAYEIPLAYPLEDDEILRRFRAAVADIQAQGKRARVAMFDVVSSRPGVVFPWEAMVRACRELGVLSLVDGAQGVGMVHLDLAAADPDFFVSNCHKWLHVPRGCALFYVPVRNQHLITSTLATSHGYQPKWTGQRTSPLPADTESPFVKNFLWMGTRDDAPFLCVKDAVVWRRDVLGGEERILAYLWDLNKKGSDLVGAALGTPVLENAAGTLRNCAMANVALPIWIGAAGEGAGEGDVVVPADVANKAWEWMGSTLVKDYKTFLPVYADQGRFWVRLSAQVYLGLGDYEYAAKSLKELVERARKKQYLPEGKL